MAYPGGVEAVKRTLQDIRGNNNLMVRVTVVLAGNLSQTMLVPRGTRADE
jgi:hypothetical protein